MKAIRQMLFGLVATLATVAAAQAASPAGTWHVNSNGYTTPAPGVMAISVSAAGIVTGTFLGNPIKGFWNDSAGKLTFYRAIGGTTSATPPENIQIYTGFMHPCSVSYPTSTQCLEGSFLAFPGTGGTATRNEFGWYGYK